MHRNCYSSTNSKILWDRASTMFLSLWPPSETRGSTKSANSPFLTPKQNNRLNWEENLSFVGQHNNRQDTSNSLCKKIQCERKCRGEGTSRKSNGALVPSFLVDRNWANPIYPNADIFSNSNFLHKMYTLLELVVLDL